MMIKTSLFAAGEREAKLDKLGDILQAISGMVDFAGLAAKLDAAAPRPGRERGGRPPFLTELMVRVLVLQKLYGLSDEQVEYQVLGRKTFQRLVGLEDSSQVPDRTTVWEFRERLVRAGAETVLFDAVDRELNRHGYLARGGQMVDASLVPAPRQHFDKEEKAIVEQDAMPVEWAPAKRRQEDLDARRTKKHGKSHFGYKLTANADKRYKLIRKLKVTTASEHYTLHLEDVPNDGNTCRDLYADKGYVGAGRAARLQEAGLRTHIQRKAAKGKPLSACQKRRNTRIARRRARVEHVFASLKHLGGNGVRTVGLARATLQLNLKAAVYNIRRLCSLKACGIRPAFA